MAEQYDFSGWATKNDLTCSDGRIIRQDAFKDCDGMEVPLVWMHSHNDPENVLGHCLLENRKDGVYTYGSFNRSKKAKAAKEQLRHGDINGLSIWANHLQQSGNSDGSVNVIHGDIKEVSLVLSGANPGAMIDTILEHSGEVSDDDLIIFAGEKLDLDNDCFHSDTEEDSDEDIDDSDEEDSEDEDENMTDEVKSVQEVFDNMTDEQKEAVYYIVGAAAEDSDAENEVDEDEELDDEDEEYEDDDEDYEDYEDGDEGDEGGEMAQSDFGDYDMRYNVFDNTMDNDPNTLSQADMDDIFKEAKRCGSLKEAVLAHEDGNEEEPTITYGIENIDYLFPEAQTVGDVPNMISRDMKWVSTLIGCCHHSPFSRIKTMNADITADEARALGYIKGNLKKEEVFGLLKRTTDPQTIYKKQKLDRDDMVDITDFNVVAFLKTEMRTMLDEEIARAVLVGDGREVGTEDHISEDHIRPIYKDAALYSVKVKIDVENGAPGNDKAKAFIDGVIRNRKLYKGSGSPTCFMTEDMLTECLLLEDGIGHKMYADEAAVARAIRCTNIVTVPVMAGLTDNTNGDLAAIIVNLADYNIGADKGGAINMFDDFDIDYNQQKYLIETRISGALTKPYSALVVSIKEAA